MVERAGDVSVWSRSVHDAEEICDGCVHVCRAPGQALAAGFFVRHALDAYASVAGILSERDITAPCHWPDLIIQRTLKVKLLALPEPEDQVQVDIRGALPALHLRLVRRRGG